MPTKKKEKFEVISLAKYSGIVARVCAKLKIVPSVLGQDKPKHLLEFEALREWCDKQK